MIELTRRYHFPAAHVLRHHAFTDEENECIYGKCAHPNGHGHDYGLEVTVGGPLDPKTGAIVRLPLLDEIVEERVITPFSHTLLNGLEAFADQVPTAENLLRVIQQELAEGMAERCAAQLLRVRLIETRRNHFEMGARS